MNLFDSEPPAKAGDTARTISRAAIEKNRIIHLLVDAQEAVDAAGGVTSEFYDFKAAGPPLLVVPGVMPSSRSGTQNRLVRLVAHPFPRELPKRRNDGPIGSIAAGDNVRGEWARIGGSRTCFRRIGAKAYGKPAVGENRRNRIVGDILPRR